MFAPTLLTSPTAALQSPDRTGLSWYCLHTRPKKEQVVSVRIGEGFGVEVYAPRIRERRPYAGATRVQEGPLFPRYLFCRCDLKDHYRAIKHAADVIDVVSFGGRPAVVSNELIDSLRRWAGTIFDPLAAQAPLTEGDRVTVTGGTMRGLDGIFMSDMNDRERVAVVLSILERDVQVTLSRWQVAPAR